MLGFETVGNATLIVYDGKPLITTDPWVNGSAYFDSWTLPYEIPETQKNAILQSEFIWFSHGHPDHLNPNSLDLFTSKKILLSDHVGSRIYKDFTAQGLNVTVLPERQWFSLSKNVSVMSVSDYNQDAALLVNINGTLVINLNDTGNTDTLSFLRRVIAPFKDNFLLKLFGFGDVDMINCYTENGEFITPAGFNVDVVAQVEFWSKLFGAKYVVPFSCFHRYQRSDSVWANQYATPLDRFFVRKAQGVSILPAFIRYDVEKKELTTLDPKVTEAQVVTAEEANDSWATPLQAEDIAKLQAYIKSFEYLPKKIGFVDFVVGGKKHHILLNKDIALGIQFDVPRNSLMTTVEYNIFDDLLIGNFMKTTFIGPWKHPSLYPDFTPVVGKYGDNGLAKTEQELNAYFKAYSSRDPWAYLKHKMISSGEQMFRKVVDNRSPIFKLAKKSYLSIGRFS